MKIYDQHLHTFLSSDAHESFESYLQLAEEQGMTHFVSTEHLDLSCLSLGMDDVYDMAAQEAILVQLQNKYSLKLLKGVELGYKFSRIKDIEHIVAQGNFDVVIMSVHESEESECTGPLFLQDRSANMVYEAYLDLYIDMLRNVDCYDIVGHIDYLLRYIPRVDIAQHEEKLRYLLKLIIEKDKCLEYNTRFLYFLHDSTYLECIFTLYHELGGRKVSLGSDAHTKQRYCASFEEALEMLKRIGFTHITTFQKRKESPVRII